jgi:hypothetical protein
LCLPRGRRSFRDGVWSKAEPIHLSGATTEKTYGTCLHRASIRRIPVLRHPGLPYGLFLSGVARPETAAPAGFDGLPLDSTTADEGCPRPPGSAPHQILTPEWPDADRPGRAVVLDTPAKTRVDGMLDSEACEQAPADIPPFQSSLPYRSLNNRTAIAFEGHLIHPIGRRCYAAGPQGQAPRGRTSCRK